MKRVMFFFACILASLSYVNAQVIQGTSNAGNGVDTGDITYGVKAGLGGSTFFGSGFVGIGDRIGGFVGGIAEIPAFFDGFYLQPEVLFSLEGSDIGFENLNLLYLQFPLMGKYHITDEIAVEFGPQLGFLIADNFEAIGNDTNTINLGVNIGGGYRLNENFYFQLRFSPSFTNVFDNTNLKNASVRVGAAYFFN